MTIMSAFMIVTITLLLVTSMLLYSRFSLSSHETIIQNTQSVMKQTQEKLEDYLVSMRRISDAVNFNVIAEYDVSNPSLEREMSLIYESYCSLRSKRESHCLCSGGLAEDRTECDEAVLVYCCAEPDREHAFLHTAHSESV